MLTRCLSLSPEWFRREPDLRRFRFTLRRPDIRDTHEVRENYDNKPQQERTERLVVFERGGEVDGNDGAKNQSTTLTATLARPPLRSPTPRTSQIRGKVAHELGDPRMDRAEVDDSSGYRIGMPYEQQIQHYECVRVTGS